MYTEANSKEELLLAIQELQVQLGDRKKSETALKDSFTRNKALLDAIPDLMFELDEDCRFVDFHADRPDNLYKNPEFFLGKTLEEVMPPDIGKMTCSRIKEILSSGKPDIITYDLEIAGEVRNFESRGVRNGSSRVLVIVRDITSLRREIISHRESDERYRSILQASPDNITITDLAGNIIMTSAVGLKVFGYESEDEIRGRKIIDFIAPSDHERALMNIGLMHQGIMTGPAEYKGLRKDGTILNIEANAEFIKGADEQHKEIVFIIRDVSSRKLAEEALMIKDWAIESSISAIAISDLSGNLTYANPAFIKLWGYNSISELSGKEPESFWDMGFKTNEVLDDLKVKGRWSGEMTALDALGAQFDVWVEASIVKDSEGKPQSMLASFADITERKRAENELRKLSRAVEQSPVSIIITDHEGNIVYSNPKVCELTGYSTGQLLGKNPRIFQSGHTPMAVYKDLWDTIHSGNEWKGEVYNSKKNGEKYWEYVSISPIFDADGKIINFLAIKEDITERKNMIASLKDAKEKAEAGNRLKTAFMNNISHEVRTPLNGILGFTSLISQTDITAEEREKFQSLIKISSNRLLRTITNYMDISLLASGNLEVRRKSFDLNSLLNLINNKFQPLCAEKNLLLQLEIPHKNVKRIIHSDAELFQTVLSHLIDNAITFTHKGNVTFGYEIRPGAVDIFVRDTGVGINPNALSAIFESFVQEEYSTSSGHEGSGLGLSIAQGVGRLLGGEILAESEQGIGSTFTFTFPYDGHEEAFQQISGNAPEFTAQINPLILIAEDDLSNLLLTKAMLKESGASVLTAKNGQEAVDHCRENPGISLVLMDLKMPVMDGIEATRQIRSLRKTIPVIAVTSFALSGDEKRAIEAGCSDYLAKPFEKSDLYSKLRRYGIGV